MTAAYETAGSCARCPWLEASGMPRVGGRANSHAILFLPKVLLATIHVT